MDNNAAPPHVMVSSTFYDLRRIRDDLRCFLQDDLGYRPLLSEHPSFPIDPDAKLAENCRRRVERDADVLVLVVGGRYGSIDRDSGKSVTNLEYLAARHKGIPIYAFIARDVLALLPAWKAEPTRDFSSQVDTPKLFEFVEQVGTVHGVWVQGFNDGRDIIDALRTQFAYEHRAGLVLRRRLAQRSDQRWLDNLQGATLRIALEEPAGWEFRLFAFALIDSIARHDHLRRRHETGIPLGLGEDIANAMPWIQARFADAKRMSKGLERLVNHTLQEALGPTGAPASAEKIVFVAEAIGDVYADALRWASRIRAANIEGRFERLRSITADAVSDLIRQVREFGPYIRDTWETALSAPPTLEKRTINMTLTIGIPPQWVNAFDAELKALGA